ncbi:hypothetical protein LX97_01591 [Nonlabens dokdonensis]|jgi:hypothetical protein|uniref:Outer membrane protein beta-barrel domain-containing protein n=2 Tax=Nonlabens dokdonensis TaxID=328515 RepID=L7WEI1_NONDD|nr:hypothetical protein [Nonlabens dokdonensis]AGC77283.1 hypothetical protein DDD_2156 [Nonlabens dokdonensis DSW-6]PZX40818.1 hypothetical protein LX97_01591 [Nonlabens dokdonensis]
MISNSLAQSEKGEFVNLSIGFGISAANPDYDLSANGFYAKGEYIYNSRTWLSLRPYVAYINTSLDEENSDPNLVAAGFDVSTNALFLGGKIRLLAPIPYVAPFFELGYGLNLGSFRTFTPEGDQNVSGLSTHIPFSIGLAIGKRHNFEISFDYFFHTKAKQTSGGGAFGITIPLETLKNL